MKSDSIRLSILTAIIVTVIAGASFLLMRSGEPTDADKAVRAMNFTSSDRAPASRP